jgi:hypothetical protein
LPFAAARREGVSDTLIDALRERRPLPAMSADEAAVVNYASEFFQTHKVSQEPSAALTIGAQPDGTDDLNRLLRPDGVHPQCL